MGLRTDNSQNDNPPITPLLRLFTLIEAFVLIVVGGALLFLPSFVAPLWPWETGPFNLRFFGAIYLASLIAVAMVLVFNRWAPARLVVPMIFVFTAIVLIVSLLYVGRFRLEWPTWIWFLLYLALPINAAYYLWLNRGQPPADPISLPAAWRIYMLIQMVVVGLYGLGILLAPITFSAFWPWELDDFHGRTYSALFFTGAIGAFLSWRFAAPSELLTMGMTQFALGLLAILGLIATDAAIHRVDWSLPGTWLWIGAFGVALIAGLGMVWWSLAVGREERR